MLTVINRACFVAGLSGIVIVAVNNITGHSMHPGSLLAVICSSWLLAFVVVRES